MMCNSLISGATIVWGPIATMSTTILWYADSKDYEIDYMPETRLALGLSAGILALVTGLCEVGVF